MTRMALALAWLYAWQRFYPRFDCLVAVLFILPVVGFIAQSMLESALLRRRALVGMYLRPGPLYNLLRGGWLLAGWQVCKALLFGLILLVEALAWEDWIWALLAVDIVFLQLMQNRLARGLTPYVKPGQADRLARHALVGVNTVLFAALITLAGFFLPHNNYQDMSLAQAVEYEAGSVHSECPVLQAAARLAAAKNALGWWLAQTWLGQSPNAALAVAGWLIFLLSSAAFMWSYSRLLSGMNARPFAVGEDNDGR